MTTQYTEGFQDAISHKAQQSNHYDYRAGYIAGILANLADLRKVA